MIIDIFTLTNILVLILLPLWVSGTCGSQVLLVSFALWLSVMPGFPDSLIALPVILVLVHVVLLGFEILHKYMNQSLRTKRTTETGDRWIMMPIRSRKPFKIQESEEPIRPLRPWQKMMIPMKNMCDHSNETSSTVLSHGAGTLMLFSTFKCKNSLKI